jgi:RNA polymerase sigma factor (sigma-70 family)
MGQSDAELLEAARRGEREAFGVLIERYQGVVCAVSYSRTGDRALSEDVAQDTFIAAWRQLHQLREPGRLRSWLCGIARNLARKARRRSAREAPLDRALVFEGANPFDEAVEAESERVVREALSRVPAIYRDVLVLYYRDQRAARDVATALGLTEAAVQQRLTRGRQYLADGVTDLVERALRTIGPSRSLAALVLAALPAFAPSRAEAATGSLHSHGGLMFKLAAIITALAATGTTAYVVHSHAAAPATAAAPAAQPAPVPAAKPARAVVQTVGPAPRSPALPERTAPGGIDTTPGPDEAPAIDAATSERVGLYRGPARGAAGAPVTIAVFTDMLCQFCGNALGTIDQMLEEYAGKVKLVVKEFPVNAAAVLPAEAAFAADAQGKFWELHDLMLANQDDLSRDRLLALADRAGLDVAAFHTALDHHTYASALDADKAAATALGVNSTPTFVINGRRLVGNLPIETLRKAIDQALAEL